MNMLLTSDIVSEAKQSYFRILFTSLYYDLPISHGHIIRNPKTEPKPNRKKQDQNRTESYKKPNGSYISKSKKTGTEPRPNRQPNGHPNILNTHMAMVTSDTITLLNDVKPYKPTFEGVKIIHCTCKRLFLACVQKLQVGQWRFIENFALTAAAGKYQPTSHNYHQLARCLWNRFAEQMLYAYKVGQVQTTNAFDSSTIEINMLRIYEIDFASGIFEI
ncbi:hypothetical protein YC2023_061765 [Brassica napus]